MPFTRGKDRLHCSRKGLMKLRQQKGDERIDRLKGIRQLSQEVPPVIQGNWRIISQKELQERFDREISEQLAMTLVYPAPRIRRPLS